jgi:hypothetical protein
MKQRIATGVVEQLIQEAYNPTNGELTVTVIRPGFNKSKGRFYPKSTLVRDHKVFEGAKMFADHQTEADSRQRPEGSINNWVAQVKSTFVEEDGTIKAKAAVIDPPFKAKLDLLHEKGLLNEMGVSIRASGIATRQDVEGTPTNYVESFLSCRSVDFVTFAGAGGLVEAIESASSEEDVELLSEEDLRKRRPDLVSAIEARVKEEVEKMKTVEEQLNEANAALATEKAKTQTLETQIAESEKTSRKATAAAELSKLLTEAKLPKPAEDRIRSQFKEAEKVEGMKEAIASEQEYIRSITPAKGVKNLGGKDNIQEGSDEKKVNLVESFQRMGLSEAEAKIAAQI